MDDILANYNGMRKCNSANFEKQDAIKSDQKEPTYSQWESLFNLFLKFVVLIKNVGIKLLFNRQKLDVNDWRDEVKELEECKNGDQILIEVDDKRWEE